MEKMLANYALDIVNSENWEDSDWLMYTRDRLIKMRSKRSPYDEKWKQYEAQIDSETFYDNDGTLQVNIPLEKDLIEVYEGRTNGKVTYDIVPDGQTDIEQLQPAKYSLQFFLDGNGKENFWIENKKLRRNKSSYGSGIFYTGIRSYKNYVYKPKIGAEFEDESDIQNEKNFDKIENETWFFHPKNIHPKDFFIDDGAYGQPDTQYADDCIFKEKITATEFNMRYGKNKAFKNQGQVTYWQDINPKNDNDQAVDVRYVVIYHYFHRITGKYIIMANEQILIYNGLYLYDDGKLPFVNIQHYTRTDRFRGEGIPERVAYLKAYKSEIMQDILTASSMASGVNLLVGNDDQIGQDWTVGGRQMNIWRTTGGAEKVQQVNSTPNTTVASIALQMIDQQTIIDSGINLLAQVESQAPTLGQEELLEANKAVRNSSVDENYNIGLDEALTMTLARIKQFAPSLLSEKIKGTDGKILKIIFPKIRIEGMEVKRKGGLQVFEESLGKYGYFELKPDVVQGVGVKVTTQSTNSLLPTLEKQKITDYINNVMTLANMARTDQTGKMMQQLSKYVKFEDLMDWMNDAFGYDSNGLKSKTEKDKKKEANIEKIQKLTDMLQINPPTNETAPTTNMEQTPTSMVQSNNSTPTAGILQEGNATSNQGTALL